MLFEFGHYKFFSKMLHFFKKLKKRNLLHKKQCYFWIHNHCFSTSNFRHQMSATLIEIANCSSRTIRWVNLAPSDILEFANTIRFYQLKIVDCGVIGQNPEIVSRISKSWMLKSRMSKSQMSKSWMPLDKKSRKSKSIILVFQKIMKKFENFKSRCLKNGT